MNLIQSQPITILIFKGNFYKTRNNSVVQVISDLSENLYMVNLLHIQPDLKLSTTNYYINQTGKPVFRLNKFIFRHNDWSISRELTLLEVNRFIELLKRNVRQSRKMNG